MENSQPEPKTEAQHKTRAKALEENRTPAILQLPLELITATMDGLPAHSKPIFAQTCRSMRNILAGRCEVAPQHETEGRLRYLSDISRLSHDSWVCSACVAPHRVNYDDTPGGLTKTKTPLQFCDILGDGVCQMRNCLLAHRHARLALKYTRLASARPIHQAYLENLLAHIRTKCSWQHRIGIAPHCSMDPKVAKGRYL